MKKAILITEARELLRSRTDLQAGGMGERAISTAVRTGALVHVRRDRYVDAVAYGMLWHEGRHLVQTVAAAMNLDRQHTVFWGPSAAVLHGIPLYRLAPSKVHTVTTGGHHGRTRAGILQHEVELSETDVAEIDGIRCTSLDRTILDLACTASPEAAVAAADAAQRREVADGMRFDSDRAAAWRERMADRAALTQARGIRRARPLLSFADGRAQLPGESVSRLHLHRLGFRDLLLQVPVTGPAGDEYWMDFGFSRSKAFGEFDGKGKYLDEDLRNGRTPSEVVWDEKRREDDARGVTGWRFARWGSEHIGTAQCLARRLAGFGIHPPG